MFKILAAFVVLLVPVMASDAQLNESTEPLGGKGTEARLRKLILDTVRPASRPTAATSRSAIESVWSQPVAGLVARVEYVDWNDYAGLLILVHLKNLSHAALAVPVGNPVDPKEPRIFELHVQQGEQPWKWIGQLPMETPANERRSPMLELVESKTGNNFPRAPVILRPGESAVAYICSTNFSDVKQASRLKIVVRRPAGTAGWQGILETPPHAVRPIGELGEARPGAFAFPRYFPEFSRGRFFGGNMSGMESPVVRLSMSNWSLANALTSYEQNGVRLELERRIASEKDDAMKLYLAALAAPRGSAIAALAMLDAMKSTEYETVTSVHGALSMVFHCCDSNPPDWLVELAIAALADQRQVTGLERSNWSQGTRFTISYLADEEGGITRALGHFKCRQAIPVLTEMVQRNQARGAIDALGEIGGGLAVVLEVLRSQEKNVTINRMGLLSPEAFTHAVRAAGQLKAHEAVPILLRHLCHEDVVEALEAIGDPAVIPALERIVANGKPREVQGHTIESIQDSVWAARIALAKLKEGDPLPRYWQLLADRSMGQFARRTVVWRLGSHPDPRSVPHLLTAIKTDPSGSVVNQAITVLSVFKYKAAVAGLIDCFDADFRNREDWKRAYNPEMFQENIAKSLRTITEQSFGPDKEQWARWWREQGQKQSGLK